MLWPADFAGFLAPWALNDS